ncbi:HAD-IIIC family phosphatase [Bradyrhizobium sp. WYCCWR 13023]|uniref:HAD-IIIC family phosphatase n=1 Tax=Bradyrhizobium zhengyangense TaxID=2911009 RepID=A0A9X1RHC7_9BRAD|nr:HAD-IIIC family phosphatase [Bradyrhizobium zhengyangense]MCG2632721.1 HAD-IIIC family phosphatase [Bradyrhizobium zhengyangense]
MPEIALADISPTSRVEPTSSDLAVAVEDYRTASEAVRRGAFAALARALKAGLEANRFEETAVAIRSVLAPTLDYTSLQTLHRLFKSLPVELRGRTKQRLAILGGFTTHQLKDFIELYLFGSGIDVELYESDFGLFRQEILDPNSGLYSFKPNRVFVATNWRNIAHVPAVSDSREQVAELLDREVNDWANLWRIAHDRLGCQILQNNFDIPTWKALGNYETRHPAAFSRYISELNRLFADRAPSYVTIHDVEGLASDVGRWAWGDERFFLHAKIPCAPEHLVNYAYNVSSVIAAELGLSRKCLVLDLDNTLWGGVIGDDGLGGIRVSQGEPEGEGFLAFQRYVKTLKARGVILAVCSKNNESIAREVFEKHPDMLLRLDDISCFVANWTDKAANLRAIARQLNIGLDSLVFIDDNPAERSIIRQMVPAVAVPEVSTDPVDFIATLDRHQYFQVSSIGQEDFKRSEFYRANAMRGAVESSATGMEDFLRSLEMTATIGPVLPTTLERTAQLINKSNQFNLTTRRRSSADVLALMNSPDWIAVTASLTDRFGDNGLVSVVFGHVEEDVLDVDTWLMSCRVLKRGLEHFVLNYLCDQAGARGLRCIRGTYIPTAKNELVRDHYADLGFRQVHAGSDGRTIWELNLAERQPLTTFIQQSLSK